MHLVFPLPQAAFRGKKYYPGGDKKLPDVWHPRTGLTLELGMLFFLSPAPSARQQRGFYRKKSNQQTKKKPQTNPALPVTPGLGRKIFDVGTLFLSAVFLFLSGRSVVLILLYF